MQAEYISRVGLRLCLSVSLMLQCSVSVITGGPTAPGCPVIVLLQVNQWVQFGPTDLGPGGKEAFFVRHKCNQYCNPNWRTPEAFCTKIPARMGTSMVSGAGTLLHGVNKPAAVNGGVVKIEKSGVKIEKAPGTAISGNLAQRGIKRERTGES